jgi:hypothetical protein
VTSPLHEASSWLFEDVATSSSQVISVKKEHAIKSEGF